MKKHMGFTLMELMIVIAIIMILSGAIIARIGTGGEKAKIAKAKAEMEEIASACRAFYADTGYWPYGKNDNDYSNPWNLGDCGLIDKDKIQIADNNGNAVTDIIIINEVKANWKGPYLETTAWPYDPWRKKQYMLRLFDPVFPAYAYGTGFSVKALAVICQGPDMIPNSLWGGWLLSPPAGDDIAVLVHRF